MHTHMQIHADTDADADADTYAYAHKSVQTHIPMLSQAHAQEEVGTRTHARIRDWTHTQPLTRADWQTTVSAVCVGVWGVCGFVHAPAPRH